jgi:hypothetical protein
MLHIKFVRYGDKSSDFNVLNYAENSIDWFRTHSPLQFATEWVFSKHVYAIRSVNDEISGIDFGELRPIPNIIGVLYQARNGIKGNLADTWPSHDQAGYKTVVMVIPYDYPRLGDGRTSWDPRYGEGFPNNFAAVIIHEMCHAIKYACAFTLPRIDSQIVDVHPTNDELVRRNPTVTSVDKAVYWLSKITNQQFQLMNQMPDVLPVTVRV